MEASHWSPASVACLWAQTNVNGNVHSIPNSTCIAHFHCCLPEDFFVWFHNLRTKKKKKWSASLFTDLHWPFGQNRMILHLLWLETRMRSQSTVGPIRFHVRAVCKLQRLIYFRLQRATQTKNRAQMDRQIDFIAVLFVVTAGWKCFTKIDPTRPIQ